MYSVLITNSPALEEGKKTRFNLPKRQGGARFTLGLLALRGRGRKGKKCLPARKEEKGTF